MVLEQPIIGRFINMRSVEENDADFILKLRLDEYNSKFIGETPNDVQKQIEWISQQRNRPNDYYFLFTDKNNNKLGVISAYNIENNRAETGRFISFGNSLQNIEATLLLYDFTFYDLNIDLAYFSVYKSNGKVVSLWKRLGAVIVGDIAVNEIDSFAFELPRSIYESTSRPKIISILEKIKDN